MLMLDGVVAILRLNIFDIIKSLNRVSHYFVPIDIFACDTGDDIGTHIWTSKSQKRTPPPSKKV
jgi:hypothetical protein